MSATTPRRPRTEQELRVARIVGRNVRALRKARGLRLVDLAEKITAAGYPMQYVTIQKIETGVNPSGSLRAVTVDELVALAEALDLRPEQLLTPFECPACHRQPPAGFTCNTCGASGEGGR